MLAMRTAILAFALLVSLPARVAATETPVNFVLHPEPTAIPEVYFGDSEGITHALADYRGKVVLLNLWTTSCVSCRRELLALDRLQAMLGGPSFEVIAVAIDFGGPEPRRFQTAIGIKELALYIDTSAMTLHELGVVDLPTTLLIDWDGREIGRLMSPTEWDAPEILAFLRNRIDISADGLSGQRSY